MRRNKLTCEQLVPWAYDAHRANFYKIAVSREWLFPETHQVSGYGTRLGFSWLDDGQNWCLCSDQAAASLMGLLRPLGIEALTFHLPLPY